MPSFQPTIPLLTYRDIQAAHDFLVGAFGFGPGGFERNAEGHRWWFATPRPGGHA